MKKGTLPMAYWHHLPGVCNHLASQVGGECHRPDEGIWTPLYPASVDAPRLTAERDAARAEATRLREALVDARGWVLDACHQGAGEAYKSTPTWHMFMSTWEDAERLVPVIDSALTPPTDQGEGA